MNWYPTLMLWFAFIDAGMVIICGFVAAIYHLVGKDPDALWQRVVPAVGAIVGSTIAASLILGAARLVVSHV